MGWFGPQMMDAAVAAIQKKEAEDKAAADKTAALKAEADSQAAAQAAKDAKYLASVQERKDSIAAQKEAAVNVPSAPSKTTKFDWNPQPVNASIDGIATGQAFLKPNYIKMKKGGAVKKVKSKAVSTASKRGDGCAIRGKTKGRFV
jgi:hypothetical protein